jgi:hypothetical protein
MRPLLLIAMVAMVAMFAAAPAVGDTPATTCSPGTMGWPSLIESGGAVPSFMFGAELVMDHVAVCDDGVFFFFSTRTQGSVKDFCLGFVKPTQEAVAEYMGTDLTDPAGKSVSVLEATAIARGNYDRFRDEMVKTLGKRYKFGQPIALTKDRWKAGEGRPAPRSPHDDDPAPLAAPAAGSSIRVSA